MYNERKNGALSPAIISIGNRKYFQHGGANEGFRCQYFASLTGGDAIVVMTNSDQDGIVREVINSIAQVYRWEGFYRPVHKTVVTVPEDTLIRYRGDYALGETNISITKKDKALYLSINGGPLMQLFFSSPTDFFLMEIPASVRFEKNASGNHYDIILKDGGKDVRIIKK